MAEYFRDEQGQDVLLFIDNIFRFVQAGSEVSALLGRMPSAVGYQPTLATEMGALQERITSTARGRDHLGAGRLRAGRRHHRPRAGHHVCAPGLTTIVLDARSSEMGIYPAVEPLDSTSAILAPDDRGRGALRGGPRSAAMLQRYQELQDIITILGVEELSDDDRES